VPLVKAQLDRIQLPVDLERLDRADLVPVGHGRERRARLDGLTVDQHDAGAAIRGVAAPVGAGQPDRLADVVHEQQARLDLVGDVLAVDRQGDVHAQTSACSARVAARRSAR
jgi:hypothetical protein